jgi:hydroxypyruvate reductase
VHFGKDIARRILTESLAAIDIPRTLAGYLRREGRRVHACGQRFDLAGYEHIRVVGFGKGSFAMAAGLLDVFSPDFEAAGVLSIPSPAPHPLPRMRIFQGGHPVPNEASFEAGRAILDLLAQCDQRTLVFFLLSGGGSALVEQPLDARVTLADVQALHRLLVTCGAPIDEINAVRKHLSATKGGRLAAAAPAAEKITLGISDVPLGRESALASGPTIPDPTTCADAYAVMERYKLLDKLPATLHAAFAGRMLQETPKAGDAAFARAHFDVLLGMAHLFEHAQRVTEAAGFRAMCDNSTDDWPIDRAADLLLGKLAEQRGQFPGQPVAVIADGEVSSPVTGNGTGGRNSAFVLHCVEKIAGQGIVVLSAGTDGADGNSPGAGAVADGDTLARARAAGLDPGDYFRRSDAYTFFKSLGDAVDTGPTGNNLRDLRILLRFD